ncbi:HNH endonuclease signature motif containing protein, partial [Ornithinibacter aureus]|uniref:HNH endonuclease n=1 Tax=Ornithinibacter aureus TaxID=622664 RepID=UPI0031F0F1A6
MKAVVGVTDNEWAAFLRDRPHLTEANFWLPSGKSGFGALATGEPFLFKTHWPANRLVGGGFFSGFTRLTIQEAWEIHGEGNGVASLGELTTRIAHYRKAQPDPRMEIGCVLLRDLFFAPEHSTLPAPEDFAKSIVRFKTYQLASSSALEGGLQELLGNSFVRAEGGPLEVLGSTRGLPVLTVPRVGQQAFKSLVLTSYHRRCAITGNRVEPVLQAAHIRPVAENGQHRVDNGLLLRSDVHILFDRGYLGIDERHRLRVSPRLRSDFGNGDEFYSKQGAVIAPDSCHRGVSLSAEVECVEDRF